MHSIRGLFRIKIRVLFVTSSSLESLIGVESRFRCCIHLLTTLSLLTIQNAADDVCLSGGTQKGKAGYRPK